MGARSRRRQNGTTRSETAQEVGQNTPQATSHARAALLKDNPGAQRLQGIITTFEDAIAPYALEHHGSIHRDYYRFPFLQQASDISTSQRGVDSSYHSIGTITWHVAPVSKTIAGWTWPHLIALRHLAQRGIRHQCIPPSIHLGDRRKCNWQWHRGPALSRLWRR